MLSFPLSFPPAPQGLKSYSEKRSLLQYFNEKFHFNEMLLGSASAQAAPRPAAIAGTAPNSVGSFATSREVPPSSRSDSKMPIKSASSSKLSPTRKRFGSPSARTEMVNSKTIEFLKEGIGELGRKIETMRKEQKHSNYFASDSKARSSARKAGGGKNLGNLMDVKADLLGDGDTLAVLKHEFQQIGEKAGLIQRKINGQQDIASLSPRVSPRRSPRASPRAPTPSAVSPSLLSLRLGGEDTATASLSPRMASPAADAMVAAAAGGGGLGTPLESRPLPTDPRAMEAELLALRRQVDQERRAKAESAAELQASRTLHEESMKEVNSRLKNLESQFEEKAGEVSVLKSELDRAKDDAKTAVESEKQHTDDLIQREERLLNTLMTQLNKAQSEQLQLDEYSDEIDKVYDSLEKLYASLKSETRPLPIAPPPVEAAEGTVEREEKCLP